MKKSLNSFALVLLLASVATFAQQPTSAPQQTLPAASPHPSEGPKTPDRADAYYHFQLGHMYEEMVAVSGRAEFATKAVEEYKAALAADPGSSYLASALAELYARTGDIREAVVAAQEVINRDPDNLDARRLLGRIYLRSIGDLQGGSKDTEAILRLAIEQYKQIVRLDPSSVEDHLLLGRLYRLNGETPKAEAEFRTSVKLQPSSEDSVTTLALLYNEEGDTNRALEILNSVPEAERSPRIDSVLGYTYEQKKDYKSAIAAYRKAVDLDKDNLDAVRGLAQNLLNDNQTDAALEQFKIIATADPQDAQTLLHISEIYRRDGQFEKSLETLSKAQTIAPDSMEIEYNRAVVEEALGKYAEAADQLGELLVRTEKSSGTYSQSERNNRAIFLERLGTVYRDENKTQLAVDTFRKMIALGDDSVARGYQQIVETYRDDKNWPAATAAAREAVEKVLTIAACKWCWPDRKPIAVRPTRRLPGSRPCSTANLRTTAKSGSPSARCTAASAVIQRPKRRSTRRLSFPPSRRRRTTSTSSPAPSTSARRSMTRLKRYFRKVIASDPKNATALNYLGYMLADRGTRLDEALSLIRRAVALDPQNGAYLDSLGWVHFKMGKYDLAEATLRRALDRIDNDPTVHEHLGDVYQKTNRLKLAVTQWERSLQEWKKTIPAEVEPNDVAKVQKKLDGAKVKLAKQDESASK